MVNEYNCHCRLSPCPPDMSSGLIKKYCPEAGVILDMGCGSGETLLKISEDFPNARLYGLDASPDAVINAKKLVKNAVFLEENGEETSFPNGFFDVIIAECVFSLFSNPNKAAREIKRLLAPGGIVIAGDLYTKKDLSLKREDFGAVRNVYTIEDFEGYFETSGLNRLDYMDKSDTLLSFASELIMSGKADFSPETMCLLRNARPGYGVWIYKNVSTAPLYGMILCAGLSSRMGDFKAFLPVGGESMLRRNVSMLLEAGAERVLVVTGHKADEVREHLKDNARVIFIHNPDYAFCGMLESVKVGLRILKDKCAKLLLTPVDIPAVKSSTALALTESSAEFARPCYEGMYGHPVALSSGTFAKIISDEGEGGLGSAVQALSLSCEDIAVNDRFILMDADTPEAYRKLIEAYGR